MHVQKIDYIAGTSKNIETACLSAQKAPANPSAAGLLTPANGLAGESSTDKTADIHDSKDSMAVSVTRHVSTPSSENQFKLLLHGIDTLDIGLYVSWGARWKTSLRDLENKKKRARKPGGLLIKMPLGRDCIFLPAGKGINYPYHIQFEAYNLYIGKAANPGSTPNVYLSISAKTLWLNGIDAALSWIAEDLKAIAGGVIHSVKVSRADLCADFWIPDGLSYQFLLSHKVTRNDKGKLFLGRDELETYYVADAKSAIQLRIYNKGLEIVTKGQTKIWFKDLWGLESLDNIWRFEFQLRRTALKRFGINSLADLTKKKTGVWGHLTTKWFSLRLPDNEKAERRTIHPLWVAVQKSMGESQGETKRICRSESNASPDWYLSHIDGCLSAFAALLGITNRDDALRELQSRLSRRNNAKDFEAACIKKAIHRGTLTRGGERP